MNLYWRYEKSGISREEAEKRILSLGFTPAYGRGWEMKMKNSRRRLHIVPSDGYMAIHEDTADHTVAQGRKAYGRVKEVLIRLEARKSNLLVLFVKGVLKNIAYKLEKMSQL